MFYAIGFHIASETWVIGRHNNPGDAARRNQNRSMGGGWRGLAHNVIPWDDTKASRAINMLHNSLISNIADSRIEWLAGCGHDLKIGQTNSEEG